MTTNYVNHCDPILVECFRSFGKVIVVLRTKKVYVHESAGAFIVDFFGSEQGQESARSVYEIWFGWFKRFGLIVEQTTPRR